MADTTKRRRGRPGLWTYGREDADYVFLYNMLKLAQEQPIKPYALARETFHRARARTRVPDSRIFVDEQVFIKRLGNKLKDLLEYAELTLYYRSDTKTCVEAMINKTNGYTEEEIRQEALKEIWDLLAESYQPNYEPDPIDIDEWLSKDEGPSESEIEGLIEGKLRQYGLMRDGMQLYDLRLFI